MLFGDAVRSSWKRTVLIADFAASLLKNSTEIGPQSTFVFGEIRTSAFHGCYMAGSAST